MSDEIRECSICGREYFLDRNKPGLIHQCWDCGASHETTARVGGNMIYTSKQAPEIEIKSMHDAKKFNRQTRRLGAGVTASIIANKKKAESDLFSQGTWMRNDPFTDKD